MNSFVPARVTSGLKSVCEKSSFARWGWIISHLYPLLTPWAVFFRRFAARNRWPCSTPNLQRRSHAHAEAPTLFADSGAARSCALSKSELAYCTEVERIPLLAKPARSGAPDLLDLGTIIEERDCSELKL